MMIQDKARHLRIASVDKSRDMALTIGQFSDKNQREGSEDDPDLPNPSLVQELISSLLQIY